MLITKLEFPLAFEYRDSMRGIRPTWDLVGPFNLSLGSTSYHDIAGDVPTDQVWYVTFEYINSECDSRAGEQSASFKTNREAKAWLFERIKHYMVGFSTYYWSDEMYYNWREEETNE